MALDPVQDRLVEPEKITHQIFELSDRENESLLFLLVRKLFGGLNQFLSYRDPFDNVVQDFSNVVCLIKHPFEQ